MKKNRLSSFLLALSLTLGLLAPMGAAQAAESRSAILDGMEVEATAAILVDTTYGSLDVLYDQNSHERRYPASITKVMTALLTVEAVDNGQLSLDDWITVGPEVNHEVGSGSSTQNIKEGEVMRLEDVLYCALTASANEACNVLAQAVAGSVADFVDLMNQRAAELGMTGTHFANTHGYHNEDHYTTAYDIAIMCAEAMKHPAFRTIVSSVGHTVPATNLHEARELHETNALVSNFRYIGYLYQYATGIKTGSTPEAGLCLASSASRDGRDLIAVVLGCVREPNTTGSQGMTQFSESRRLLEWGFKNFSRQTVLDSTSLRDEVEVTLSKEANYVGVEPQGVLEATLPTDLDPAAFTREVVLDSQSVPAPVEKGQVLGHDTVSNGDTVYGTLDLVAVSNVERSELLYRLDQIKQFFSRAEVKLGLLVLLVVVLFFLLRWLLFGRRRRSRYGSGRSGYGGSHYRGRRRR